MNFSYRSNKLSPGSGVCLIPPVNVVQDTNARTLSYFALNAKVRVTEETLDQLECIAISLGQNARLSLHSHQDAEMHEMVICQHAANWFRPKRHGHKDKSFHVMRGELAVFVFNESGDVVDVARLGGTSGGLIYRVGRGAYHTDIPLTSTSIHCEVTTGPFLGPTDRQLAPWAPEDGDAPGRAAYRTALLEKLSVGG